jgi:hypothetical protein
MNSHWIRGYGDPPSKTVVVISMSREFVQSAFESCQIAGHVNNRFGIENSLIRNTPREGRRSKYYRSKDTPFSLSIDFS